MAHAGNSECLVVHQLLAAQRHCKECLILVLEEFAVIMPEQDAHVERDQPEYRSRRE